MDWDTASGFTGAIFPENLTLYSQAGGKSLWCTDVSGTVTRIRPALTAGGDPSRILTIGCRSSLEISSGTLRTSHYFSNLVGKCLSFGNAKRETWTPLNAALLRSCTELSLALIWPSGMGFRPSLARLPIAGRQPLLGSDRRPLPSGRCSAELAGVLTPTPHARSVRRVRSARWRRSDPSFRRDKAADDRAGQPRRRGSVRPRSTRLQPHRDA